MIKNYELPFSKGQGIPAYRQAGLRASSFGGNESRRNKPFKAKLKKYLKIQKLLPQIYANKIFFSKKLKQL